MVTRLGELTRGNAIMRNACKSIRSIGKKAWRNSGPAINSTEQE